MSTIQAIQTEYKGYRFRSRLEARWAVFFDTLGIRYEYEKEGFELGDVITVNPETGYKSVFVGGIRYLPDFYLPNQNYWIEIKGEVMPDDWHVLQLFSYHINAHSPPYDHHMPFAQNGVRFFVFENTQESCNLYNIEALGGAYAIDLFGYDHFYYWSECPGCGKLGIGFSGWSERVCSCRDAYKTGYDSPRLLAAYAAARSARFEHGETPRVPRGKLRK